MRLGRQAAIKLFDEDLLSLGRKADEMRKAFHPEGPEHEGIVTFVVDRNINYTNICINRCSFCAFYREKGAPDAYVLGREELFRKIEETLSLDGTQILLQGGINPDLGLGFYIDMLKSIRERFPSVNVHGFSPPEICFLADKHSLTLRETIGLLKEAGLGSIPGGGAEMLSDRVREAISPRKIKSSRWLRVMKEAHRTGMRTTATMMFGSVETKEDIIEHLDAVRTLQDEAIRGAAKGRSGGFTAFIPWTFQPGNTALKHLRPATAVDYLRVLAISRLYLDNVRNIQASWVTQGLGMAQVALRFGANDFGSTMIEENVVSAAGVSYNVSKEDIINAIRGAGFAPAQRDTAYNVLRRF
jgi:cyclic dehypoxanthinyl futalosine synthase